MVPGLAKLSYEERLQSLGVALLENRQVRGDASISIQKILLTLHYYPIVAPWVKENDYRRTLPEAPKERLSQQYQTKYLQFLCSQHVELIASESSYGWICQLFQRVLRSMEHWDHLPAKTSKTNSQASFLHWSEENDESRVTSARLIRTLSVSLTGSPRPLLAKLNLS